jgi:cell division protein FtsL
MNVRLRTTGRLVPLLVPTLIVAVAASGVVVWARTEMTALGYRIALSLEEETELRSEVEKLRVEVAALSSPDRIERQARAAGLVDPRPGQIVTLEELAARAHRLPSREP